MSSAVSAAIVTVGALLVAAWLHDALVALAGLRLPAAPASPARRHRRFAILVAAHDEEAVIAPAVRSLASQEYPQDLYEVHVVADRCGDGTAAVARQAGAFVHERVEGDGPGGKPAALRWLVARLEASGRTFDAACVFDADNLAGPGFLAAVNARLDAGERCVQGYLDTKNPDDTWITGSIALAYWTTNRLWQAARERLGLSCALGGTGFALDWELARDEAWRTDCLTEDLDLQVRLVLAGSRVAWAHEARTYDEKPLALAASLRQRLRWMRGHWDVARRAAVPLLLQAVRRRSWTCLDAALYVLQPLRVVVGAAVLVAVAVVPLAGRAAPDPWHVAVVAIPYFSYLAHSCFAAMPALGLLLERVPLRAWRFYPAAFVFGLTWIPVALWGGLTSRRAGWSHTRHARALTLPDRLAAGAPRRRAAANAPLVASTGEGLSS